MGDVPTYNQYERRTSAIKAQAKEAAEQSRLLAEVLVRLETLESRVARLASSGGKGDGS